MKPALYEQAETAPAAQLALRFATRGGRSYVAGQRSTHPFHLCRTLYRPDDTTGMATVYVQGCAGGLFEHDRIAMTLEAERAARAHVTTGAATIVHRMPNAGHAEQALRLQVAAEALLEYCPDPLIMFPASRLRSRVVVRLAQGARAILTDAFLAHRLDGDQTPFAWLDSLTTIENDDGELLARERYVARGDALRAELPGVGGPYACQASVWVLGRGDSPLGALRAASCSVADASIGASTLPADCGVVVRILAKDGVALRRALDTSWRVARAELGESPARARPK